MSFTIKTNSFEGPLDLLLDLIEKRKLFISDISLAQVTDDFITHIRKFDHLPMGESAHFILIASTLLLIKSKSLLPGLNLTEEEKGDIHELESRLKIFKRIKDASVAVERMFGTQVIYPRITQTHTQTVFAPAPEYTLEKAVHSLRELIHRLPKKDTLPTHVVSKVISLEDMIDTLTQRITSNLRMSFKQFTGEHRAEKVTVIVSFLAMLELVKEGIMQVTQEKEFDDIHMETKEVGVPHY